MLVLGVCIPFLFTILGAITIFLIKKDRSEIYNVILLSLSSGVMLSASIWSLIVPAIEHTKLNGGIPWLIVSISFIFGALLMLLLDVFYKDQDKGMKFFYAVTLHNIPEGLAVGLVFGLALALDSSVMAALSFALAIAFQNLPEGSAVTIPMYEMTKSRKKAFLYGVGSGAVEPIFGIIGLCLSTYVNGIMPYALSFAAGTMLYVIISEMIPLAVNNKYKVIATMSVIMGFTIMMIIDLVFK